MMSKLARYTLIFTIALITSITCSAITTDLNKSTLLKRDVEPGWPVVPIYKHKVFTPFTAKRVLVTFDNELRNLANIEIDSVYKGKLITIDTVLEIRNKIIDSFDRHDYLLIQVNIDKDAMLSGILKLDVKAGSIDEVIIIGEGASNKLMLTYANKITSNKPAKKSFIKEYLYLMKKIPSLLSTYQIIETEEGRIDLIITTSNNPKCAYGR
jgi:hemolysin activation/secretion protein